MSPILALKSLLDIFMNKRFSAQVLMLVILRDVLYQIEGVEKQTFGQKDIKQQILNEKKIK